MRLLRANMEVIKNELRKDKDWIILIVGYEGEGKSDLGIILCQLVDPSFTVDRICFTGDQFIEQINTAPQYCAVDGDEGIDFLFARDAMKKDNKKMVAILAQCRRKNLFIVICIPDFMLIDKYLRVHRARTLLRVMKRGRVGFYSKRRMKQIRIDPETKLIKYPHPNFYDTYPKVEKKLWKQYLEKRDSITAERSVLEEATKKTQELLKNTVSMTEFAKAKGLNRMTIFQRIKNGKIKAVRDESDRWRIPKSYL